jgi:uncharacterized protein
MMMSNEVIGRKKEREILERLLQSKKAEFLAIYGRRRVGKTFLISQYFQKRGLYFEMTGSPDAPKAEQLANFSQALSEQMFFGIPQSTPKTWPQAFVQLRKALDETAQNQNKIILFFDELPWLATKRSGFLSAFQHLWNRYLSRDNRIILIVCGSAASWMIKNIIYNKKGLYGRLTAEIRLFPYSLAETENYLKAQNVHLDRRQITEIYMALGGVPQYLSMVLPGKSSAQVIQELCFTQGGAMVTEFYKLYRSLFDEPLRYVKIIEALKNHRYGLSRENLAKITEIKRGGSLTEILRTLEESGFILHLPDLGKKTKGGRYILVDEYSLFYLSWIKEAIEEHAMGIPDYWIRKQQTPAYLAWAGYAFEAICHRHVDRILLALGLNAVATSITSWHYAPPKGSGEEGAQIDQVIDRADKCINLCELKFSQTPIALDKNLTNELERKREIFHRVTKSRKTLFISLITASGMKDNDYSRAVVQSHVSLDDLFYS